MEQYIFKLERKFGKYAIKNISMYLVLLYAIGYVIYALDSSLFNYISLNPYAILRGQIWRLFSWIIIPPSLGINPIFMVLLLYVFYNFGSSLERAMGTFRYNLYLISGMLFTVLGSFILLIYLYLANLVPEADGAALLFTMLAVQFSTFYVYMSIFLALAVVIPNMEILLMFILPVKMKYLAYVYGFIILLNFIQSNLIGKIVIATSMLNFLIFFISARKRNYPSPTHILRRAVHNKEVKNVKEKTKHKCTTCGVTQENDKEREFRFCSKCHGNHEYCDKHLYTHEHIRHEENGV